MLSIASSGTREVWLDEQGQVESLRNLTTRYLLNAFHEIVRTSPPRGHRRRISKRFVDQALFDVHERARKLCAMLAAERHSATVALSVADGS